MARFLALIIGVAAILAAIGFAFGGWPMALLLVAAVGSIVLVELFTGDA